MKLPLGSCSWYMCVLLFFGWRMPAEAIECDSMDIRNDCNEFRKLANCTTIRGSLLVVLMPEFSEQLNRTCDYTQYSFPLLREITDYLVFSSVKGLSSVGRLFPNLTVIRGRRLFLDYALGVSDMPDLERLDFQSLVSIKRGHVYVGSNPKLCNMDKIDWERLTKTQGDDHISDLCNKTTQCKGCPTDHCWAEGVCQEWENKEARNCHKECLGGCSNNTAQGCYVCQGLTDHGTCVESCPRDKYLWEDRQRCYTKEECTQTLGRFVHKNLCILQCPTGFKANNTRECVPCSTKENCTKICQTNSKEVFRIVSLRDANNLKGCEEINGSVYISFENYVSEAELKLQFQSLRKIKGFLKIFRNSNLTSLSFLENLEEISAQPAEFDTFGLSIYGNKNLESLWTPKRHLTIVNASIYIHLNDNVCNQQLRLFQKQVQHDETQDSVQLNDRDVLCGDPTLDVVMTDIGHNTFRIVWQINQTSNQVEFIHRILGVNETFLPLNVDNGDICSKTLWSRRLFFKSDLHHNSTHFSYIFSDLQPDTRYGFSVKTFGDDYAHDSHSGFQFVHTQQDYPLTPFVNVIARSNDSVEMSLELAAGQSKDRILHYKLNVYERKTNLSQLYNRNYCEQPFALEPTDQSEDFDSCCSNEGAKARVRKLKENLNRELSCSRSHASQCSNDTQLIQDQLFKRHQTNQTLFVLDGLKSSHVYIVHTSACNSYGCSRFEMTVVRTLPTKHNGVGDLRACRVNDTTEYRVYFKEPTTPNDIILSYRIYYRDYIAANDSYRIRISCITPLQYAAHKHFYTAHYNSKFSEVSVSAVFLDEQVRSKWTNVTSCAVGGVQVHSAHSNTMNLFLICFMLGAVGTLLWLCYKQKYWRKLGVFKNFVCYRFALLTQRNHGDREVLVENFVTFQNI